MVALLKLHHEMGVVRVAKEVKMLNGVIVLIVIAVALLRGGSLRNLVALELRWLPLVLGSLGLQVLIFTPFRAEPLIPVATAPLYVLSMALLVIWVVLNRHIPGIILIAAGVLMNLAAIAANGGYMPVAPEAAQYAGRIARYAADGLPIANNSLAIADNVRLWILTDIFPIPAGIPLANVFSLGDVLLTTGIAILCYRAIRGLATASPARAEQPAVTLSRRLPVDQ